MARLICTSDLVMPSKSPFNRPHEPSSLSSTASNCASCPEVSVPELHELRVDGDIQGILLSLDGGAQGILLACDGGVEGNLLSLDRSAQGGLIACALLQRTSDHLLHAIELCALTGDRLCELRALTDDCLCELCQCSTGFGHVCRHAFAQLARARRVDGLQFGANGLDGRRGALLPALPCASELADLPRDAPRVSRSAFARARARLPRALSRTDASVLCTSSRTRVLSRTMSNLTTLRRSPKSSRPLRTN